MQQSPRRNPYHAPFAARRATKPADSELARVGEELQKLKRLGAPAEGFPRPEHPAAPPRPARPTLPPPQVPGEKRRSALSLPAFVPPPGPTPAPPPQPAFRRVGPPPTRIITVRNAMQLATALEQARPGDHIVLADGEYQLPNKRYALRGTADRPIVIMAAGEHVTVVGGNNPHSLQLDRCEHVVINGLRFAARQAQGARAINVTDSNHVTVVGCWIGSGAAGKDLAPVHFGSDTSGRYNNHHLVLGNVIYAQGSPAVHFGPGGGLGARVVDNDLRAVGAEGQFMALVMFTPGGMSVYRQVTVRGNRLVAERATGGGFMLNGVVGADISGNTVWLRRDELGRGGTVFELRGDANAGGQVTGLVLHHNELAYDRPGTPDARAPFVLGAPLQATFAKNLATHLGAVLAEGKFAAMVDLAPGLERA